MSNKFKKEPWTGITGTYGQSGQAAPPMSKEEWDKECEKIRQNASENGKIANIAHIANSPHASKAVQEVWNSIERAEQKEAQDKADINDLNDAIWRAVWVAVGLGLAGLFYLAYHFRFQLDLLNLGAKL